MKLFDKGALRRKMTAARADPSFATNLVHETLARHGIMPGAPSGIMTDLPTGTSMDGLLEQMRKSLPAMPQIGPVSPVPEGASFEARTYTCPAGSRSYLTYVPSSIQDRATGVVVMLHGCTQSAADFSTGTAMNTLAERDGFVVVYPQQAQGANAQSCWNWFSRSDQRRDHGEPAILEGIARLVMEEHAVGPEHSFIAGLSSGAAMALIMGQTCPDIFAAVGSHSGLPVGVAHDLPSALAAMGGRFNQSADPQSSGTKPRLIVFHGSDDHTVHPANEALITKQALSNLPRGTAIVDTKGQRGGRSYSFQSATAPDGSVLMERWLVDGLGHAWSGGNSSGSYADRQGPAASEEMVRFFFAGADLPQ